MKKGFTLLELIIVLAAASLLLGIAFIEKTNVDAMSRDDDRKTAINAMYYALEEYYYQTNNYYPESISEQNLPVIDPALFTDPSGINLGSLGSSYVYIPASCDSAGHCKEYTLKSTMEKEDTYIKTNRSH